MTKSDITASVSSYDVSLLMTQTRKLAADYRKQTGQALPVTEELARFDAISILGLEKIEDHEGIDATDVVVDRIETDQMEGGECQSPKPLGFVQDYYLIKGRVIFKAGKARQKLGKLSLQSPWTYLLMVIYDPDYLPSQIYNINRRVIEREMSTLSPDKRGSMTIAKYKAIGDLVWENNQQPESESPTQDPEIKKAPGNDVPGNKASEVNGDN